MHKLNCEYQKSVTPDSIVTVLKIENESPEVVKAAVELSNLVIVEAKKYPFTQQQLAHYVKEQNLRNFEVYQKLQSASTTNFEGFKELVRQATIDETLHHYNFFQCLDNLAIGNELIAFLASQPVIAAITSMRLVYSCYNLLIENGGFKNFLKRTLTVLST